MRTKERSFQCARIGVCTTVRYGPIETDEVSDNIDSQEETIDNCVTSSVAVVVWQQGSVSVTALEVKRRVIFLPLMQRCH
jgi:hypothetical protein